ncbi:MAG: hypothetical protein IPP91_00380 [Betaproteobacteria bacterium]|nr:hypothetical protein [Betaproteobacteria bacterium]
MHHPHSWIPAFIAAMLGATFAHAVAPAISAGNHHSVALSADGTVRTWGDDSTGQLGLGRTLQSTTPAAVLGVSSVAQVSSGQNHVVALLRDGTVWAWGANNVGQLGDGTVTNRSTPAPVEGLAGVIAISAGGDHTLALKGDGTVWSWGVNYHGELGYEESLRKPVQVPGISDVTAISAGGAHSLALKRDGTLLAWGRNDAGQLGDGTFSTDYTGRTMPSPVIGLSGVIRVAAGNEHSVAVTANGWVYAWGSNYSGQVGDGLTADRSSPYLVSSGLAAKDVAAGDDHTLLLLQDGSVYGWGGGYSGQLGDGRNTPSTTPVRASGLAGVTAIAAGNYFSVARTADGSVWTWGNNSYGQLGDGMTDNRGEPVRVAAIPPAATIAAGGYHAFTVSDDGLVRAWGANDFGELGDGVRPLRTTPAIVPGATSVTKIAGGGSHTLALKSDGTVLAWGGNGLGQLGDGSRISRSTPAPVTGLAGVKDVGAGYYSSFALKSDGTVWSWGYNYGGLLGRGSDVDELNPAQIPGLAGVSAFSAGPSHTLVLMGDRTVRAFGGNGAGELGDGTTINRDAPVPVAALTNVIAVAAGGGHSLALRSDHTVWSWGLNYSGELGDGTNIDHGIPAPVPGLTDVVAIAAGDSFSFAIRSDGTVWAWGANWDSQLGDGSGYSQTSPVVVTGIAAIVGVSGGGGGAMALKADGTVYAWGKNVDGRLGDGTFVTRDLPIVVIRDDGTGSIEANNWFLDLNPAITKVIPSQKIPVFLLVASNAGGDVKANLQFRQQDQGTTGSVFVFASAPADVVRSAKGGEAPLVVGRTVSRDGRKDAAVACVLAQLTSTGQLQAVTASSLQAYVTGVLSAQGQAVNIINGAVTANIGGATFYVGYGSNASAMLSGGLNRGVASVAGNRECKPQAPQTGWWWNAAEGGRGYSVEVAGNHIFFAAFLYDDTGRSNWYVATGNTSLDGSLFTGDLLKVTGGQTLTGAYKPPNPVQSAGPFTLAFSDASNGTMVWPGGTVAIERFNIIPGGLAAAPQANVPESGWWWNPAESGRGFFIEWQNGSADLAGYMYDEAGNPVWYLSLFPTPNPRTFSGNWWSYANGQTLMGAYKPPTLPPSTVAPVTVQFDTTTTATMTLPDGRQLPLTRHRF